MEREKSREAASVDGEQFAGTISRRGVVGGLGLIGLFLAAPKFFAPSAAQAKELTPAAAAAEPAAETKLKETEVAEATPADARETSEVTDLSSQYWRRRRYWRRYYWRPRYYRRYYWRPRRRYWRRRYWY